MCNTAWSRPKLETGEVSKLKRQLIALICLMIGTSTAGVFAFAGPLTSMTQPSVLNSVTEFSAAEAAAAAPLVRVSGASSAKRAAERAAGGRAVKVVKQGGKFVVTVVSGGSARRCIVDAKSGQVLGCR
jgi:hypothetical protein